MPTRRELEEYYEYNIAPRLETGGFIPTYLLLCAMEKSSFWEKQKLTLRDINQAYKRLFRTEIKAKTWQSDLAEVLSALKVEDRQNIKKWIKGQLSPQEEEVKLILAEEAHSEKHESNTVK